MLICPSCGRENPDEARFCMACATPLVGEHPTEERKVVTALFCDLVGFTARSDRADPEDIQAALRPYHARVRNEIQLFGGVVEKFIGDAVVGVFGVPAAHEDDPERAVRAALRIIGAIEDLNRTHPGIDLAVRVAVNTGEAVVSLGPSPISGEGLVTGDVVNTASRLQTVAPVGGVVVGELTYRVSRHAIEYEELEPATVKGKAEPLRIWRAVAARSAGPEPRTHITPLVGRDEELSALVDVWRGVVVERRPRLVTLLGPPGIGKSRLLRELASRIAPEGRMVAGRCRAYGETTGYGAFGQQVQGLVGIFDTDPAATAREKLADRLVELFPREAVAELASHLEVLLGLSEAGTPDRQPLLSSARRLAEGVAAEQPTVMAFEDVHAASPSLLDLIESMAVRITDVPLLLATSARPELLDARPTWDRLPGSKVITVAALSDEEARELANLLPRHEPDAEALDQLVRVGAGNPLFLEELGAAITERGLRTGEELPTTIQAIIAARLDALPRRERRVIQGASVIGRFFWRGALRAVAGDGEGLDEALESLEGRDFIARQMASRIPGDREFAFKHALTREVAYSTLPRAVRRERHGAVAHYLEDALGDRLRDSASMLAHHWKHAGESRKAATYLMTAAEVASRAWAKQEAAALYTEAIELHGDLGDPEVLEECIVARAATLLDAGASVDELEQEITRLSDVRGPNRTRALLTSALAGMAVANASTARSYAEMAATAAMESGEAELEANALEVLSEVAGMDGELEKAIDLIRRSLDLWPFDARGPLYAEALTQAALYHYWRGDYEEAARLGMEGYAQGLDTSDLTAVVSGAGHAGMALTGLSRHEEALEWFERGIRHGREWEMVPRHTSRVVNMRAGTLRELGDVEGARRANQEGLEMAREAAFVGATLGAQVDLLIDDVLEGHLGRAENELPRLLHAAAETRGWHQWLWTGRLLHAGAQIALGTGRHEAAAARADQALRHALRPLRLKYACASRAVLGEALLALGRPGEALDQLQEAARGAERLRHAPTIWPALLAQARALEALGRDDEAEGARARALEVVRGFASGLSQQRRGTFLSSAPVAALGVHGE